MERQPHVSTTTLRGARAVGIVCAALFFAPVVLSVPDGVDVRKVDLSIELQILAYHEQRKSNVGAQVGSRGATA